MAIKKLIVGLLISVATKFAIANPYSEPYVGILGGGSSMNYTSDNQNLNGASKDEQTLAWYLFAGYQFNQNFALHAGYLQFGNIKFEGINEISGANSEYSQKALEIAGKFIYPLSSVATVYAKGGGAFVNLDCSPNSLALTASSGDITKLRPTYGLGFTYMFYPGISGEVTWTEISGGSGIETSNFIGVGVNFAVA